MPFSKKKCMRIVVLGLLDLSLIHICVGLFARAAMTSKHCQGCEGKCVLSRNRHIPRAMEDLKEF